MDIASQRPDLSPADALEIARSLWSIEAVEASALPSDRDQNFRISSAKGELVVLKIASAADERAPLELQHRAMRSLAASLPGSVARVLPTPRGELLERVASPRGLEHWARVVSWIDGEPLASSPRKRRHLRALGELLGRVDLTLEPLARDFSPEESAAARRRFHWDLAHAGEVIESRLAAVESRPRRELLRPFLRSHETHVLPALRVLGRSLIHNDANDHNVVVRPDGSLALIDFGDLVETATVFELAVAAAYVLFDTGSPAEHLDAIVAGYHATRPLEALERELLHWLVGLRLATSVVVSATQRAQEPDNEYLSISEASAWRALEWLATQCPVETTRRLERACGLPSAASPPKRELLAARRERMGGNLSVSYRDPLVIVRGLGAYLHDERGAAYLDLVNNVCHVGHCHPRVVRAGAEQMAILNTNTRYLHERVLRYAERLLAKFPPPLSVVFFTSSGSEANELALRLARAHTGRRDVAVVDAAYHGNTSALVDLSPYKHSGPGGLGAPDWVETVPIPDPYRGEHRGPSSGPAYASALGRLRCVESRTIAAFFCESILGCGGQIVLPDGYLRAAFERVREAGGVCVADEVQVGFGRVGEGFWAFELQGVVPDIVTLGKPMGNGHPLAGVVTTREIADSFANGMEYFSTFGGNPVSAAIGEAVLDVIEEERLVEHAGTVGEALLHELRSLASRHELVGDVRGRGLFLGVELVRDRETLEPAAAEASSVVETLRERGILASTDGPLHNVLKLKPPLVISRNEAMRFVEELDRALRQLRS